MYYTINKIFFLEEIKVDPVENKLVQYKQEQLNHVSRLEDIRYAKQHLSVSSFLP
jgi:hypothetical protein